VARDRRLADRVGEFAARRSSMACRPLSGGLVRGRSRAGVQS
jgi:hypothetical protein